MTKIVQLRRGNTLAVSNFTGLSGEVVVDTDKNTLIVHNGSDLGGFPLARADFSNVEDSVQNKYAETSSLVVGSGAKSIGYLFDEDNNYLDVNLNLAKIKTQAILICYADSAGYVSDEICYNFVLSSALGNSIVSGTPAVELQVGDNGLKAFLMVGSSNSFSEGIMVQHKLTGQYVSVDLDDWKIKFRAWF